MTESSMIEVELTENICNTSNVIQTSTLTTDTIPKTLSEYNTIKLSISSLSLYDPLSLSSLVPSLTSNGSGKIIIEFPKTDSQSHASAVHTSLLLSGLTAQSEKIVNKMDKEGKSTEYISITAVFKPVARTVAKISVRPQEDDDEYVDEDELLLNPVSGLNMPLEKAAGIKDDCDGRKPCDNCTCGRAEREAVTVTEDLNKEGNKSKVIKDFKSSCGNCAKGDAFRCAGCPYLGMPAFKEGEAHLVLDLEDDL